MVKCGFIADEDLLQVDESNYEQYILRVGRIKKEIVEQDFRDRGHRQILNFGHTVGHAIEAYSLTIDTPLTHGESVALGMWCALWLSIRQCGLREETLSEYVPTMKALIAQADMSFDEVEVDAVMNRLVHDKKSHDGQARFVLLKAVEKPLVDQQVDEDLIRESIVELLKCLNN